MSEATCIDCGRVYVNRETHEWFDWRAWIYVPKEKPPEDGESKGG